MCACVAAIGRAGPGVEEGSQSGNGNLPDLPSRDSARIDDVCYHFHEAISYATPSGMDDELK